MLGRFREKQNGQASVLVASLAAQRSISMHARLSSCHLYDLVDGTLLAQQHAGLHLRLTHLAKGAFLLLGPNFCWHSRPPWPWMAQLPIASTSCKLAQCVHGYHFVQDSIRLSDAYHAPPILRSRLINLPDESPASLQGLCCWPSLDHAMTSPLHKDIQQWVMNPWRHMTLPSSFSYASCPGLRGFADVVADI